MKQTFFFACLMILFMAQPSYSANFNFESTIRKMRRLAQQQHINLSAFDRAFAYLKTNPQIFTNKNYVTLIDYSKPSHTKRLFLFDLRQLKIHALLVAHGKGSGEKDARAFSNTPNSYQTSLGFLKTGKPYVSSTVGLALRLHGLEERNNQAYDRGIVMHGAWYVSQKIISKFGRLGRSLGCPAVESEKIQWVVDKLQGGSLIYAFR